MIWRVIGCIVGGVILVVLAVVGLVLTGIDRLVKAVGF